MPKEKVQPSTVIDMEELDEVATSQGRDDELPLTQEEAHELQVRQVLRLRLKGLTLMDISKYIGKSFQKTKELMAEANAGIRAEIQDFDYPLFIGDSIHFYNEVRDSNMALANSADTTTPAMKTLCMRTAMTAETAKHNFLQKVGLFSRPSNSSVFEPEIQESKESTDADDFQEFLQDIANASGRLIQLDPPDDGE